MAQPIVHIEIPASDTKAAASFYSELFGWKLEHAPEFDYWQFQAEGGPGGGFVNVDEITKPGDVLIYVSTDDIDGTLSRIEAHGGKTIAPKMEIPQTGWFAIFSDPTGNRIGLYTTMHAQP